MLKNTDPQIHNLITKESYRQQNEIMLIPSENTPSPEVISVLSSVFTNKYAEGYPGKRYYGGCQFVDEVENLAILRAKKLFGADHVNVQPHSGVQANEAVFLACLQPGDPILGMGLYHGGHLSHGLKVNLSGIYFKPYAYQVDINTGLIDYNQVEEIALKVKPKLIICGASAYSRIIDFKAFASIAQKVGAKLLADVAHISGLIATGFHPSPVPYADFITTTTHKTLRGPRGAIILCKEEYAKAIDKAVFPGVQGGPHMHTIAAKAVAFEEALQPEFKSYCQNVVVNSNHLAQALIGLGYSIVSGGTDNHLFIVDLRNQTLTGKDSEDILAKVGIIVNKNTLPGDPRSPQITSGIRMGTPAITSRGFVPGDMPQLADAIHLALIGDTFKSQEIIEYFIRKYPLYPHSKTLREFGYFHEMSPV